MTGLAPLVGGAVAVAGVGCAGLAAYFSPAIWKYAAIRRLRRACAQRRSLVLTYDDGPGPTLTPAVLDLLAAHSARATFFLLGRRVAVGEELVNRITSAGHEIGCHGYDHVNAWRAGPRRVVRDIERGYEAIACWAPPGTIYRPAHGKATLATLSVLRRRRAAVGWWTIDSGDTHASLPDPQHVVDRLSSDGGGVVLLHDFDRTDDSRAARHSFVLETTRLLIEHAHASGMRVEPLGVLLAEAHAGFSRAGPGSTRATSA